MENSMSNSNELKPMQFGWAFFWEGRDGDCIRMEGEPALRGSPGFQQNDEVKFVADDGKHTIVSACVVKRIFDLHVGFVRVYLRKLD
jgi:hypothetical protein